MTPHTLSPLAFAILQQTRAILAEKEHCKLALYRDACGRRMHPVEGPVHAVCFKGALNLALIARRAYGELEEEQWPAAVELDNAFWTHTGHSAAAYNDRPSTTKESLLALLDVMLASQDAMTS